MKIGAQRLYKAVLKGDSSTVLLFLTSESKGPFSYQKVYDAWVNGGRSPAMLDVLLQYEPFMNAKQGWHRRNKKNFDNGEFRFLAKVIEVIRFEYKDDDPITERLVWMRDMVKVLESYKQGGVLREKGALDGQLVNGINHGKEWPWPIAAESRDLGWHVATYGYSKKETQVSAIEWFLDMHGPVVEKDLETYAGFISRFTVTDNYPYLTQLLTPELLKTWLPSREEYVKQRLRWKKEYDALVAIAPWVEGYEVVKEEDEVEA